MRLGRQLGSLAAFLAGILGVAAASPWSGAAAYTLRTLYSFCSADDCKDGISSGSRLLMDARGNLFGVGFGGAAQSGVLFELIPNAGKTKWKYELLYSFCKKSDCADGAFAETGLVMDVKGNLYGTASQGGKHNGGTVFELMPSENGSNWTLKVLHAFCSESECADGALPITGLTYVGAASGALYDGVSPLYGTTASGGAHSQGAAFSVTPHGSRWSEEILYSFCSMKDCVDGKFPSATLLADEVNSLYGTTMSGGTNNSGIVFKLSARGPKTPWTESVLYSFCAASNCSDGAVPEGDILMDASGSLFGTTGYGGQGAQCPLTVGCGVAFRLEPAGEPWQVNVLHSFCSLRRCLDGTTGQLPSTGLTLDSSGVLFGATFRGGGHNRRTDGAGGGTIFKIDGDEEVLYAFCAKANCRDGGMPGAVITDSSGNLFGTTMLGGAKGNGTIFELIP